MAQTNKIFIGNLSFKLDERDLEEAFEQFGEITEINIPTDRDSGRKRGFAFITFGSDDFANQALSMNGKELDGRALTVKIAQDKKSHGGSGSEAGNRASYSKGNAY